MPLGAGMQPFSDRAGGGGGTRETFAGVCMLPPSPEADLTSSIRRSWSAA